MKGKLNQWTWNDGWILMSLYLVQSKGNCLLSDIISAADAINHAIPTTNEFSNALTKLVNAGLLDIVDKHYNIKQEFMSEIESAYKQKEGLFESARKGKNWLNNSKFEVIKKPRLTITQEELILAYKNYINQRQYQNL